MGGRSREKFLFLLYVYRRGIAAQSSAGCHVEIPREIDGASSSRDNPKTFPKQNPSTESNHRSKPHKPTPSSLPVHGQPYRKKTKKQVTFISSLAPYVIIDHMNLCDLRKNNLSIPIFTGIFNQRWL